MAWNRALALVVFGAAAWWAARANDEWLRGALPSPAARVVAAAAAAAVVVACARRGSRGGACAAAPDLRGRLAVVTGGSRGIGAAVAAGLAARGASVVIACRDPAGAAAVAAVRCAAAAAARARASDAACALPLDLESHASVVAFVRELRALVARRRGGGGGRGGGAGHDGLAVLVCNAGAAGLVRGRTGDGVEPHFAANLVGHFLLVSLLAPELLAARGRVVVAGAPEYAAAADGGGVDLSALRADAPAPPRALYGMAKLGVVLFVDELQRRFEEAQCGASAYVAVPGARVDTRLGRSLLGWAVPAAARPIAWLLLATPAEGAACALHCALSDDAVPGRYHEGCEVRNVARGARDAAAARALWAACASIVAPHVDAAALAAASSAAARVAVGVDRKVNCCIQ